MWGYCCPLLTLTHTRVNYPVVDRLKFSTNALEAAVRTLTLDLETIPSHNPAVKTAIYARDAFFQVTEIGPIEPDSRLKDPEKIAKSIEDRTLAAHFARVEGNQAKLAAADKIWRDTALDGWFGHIAIIGFAVDDEPAESITTIDVSTKSVQVLDSDHGLSAPVTYDVKVDVSAERLKIMAFFEFLGDERFLVIGHRVRKFDLLFLWQRCIVLGIRPPYWLVRAKDSTRYQSDCIADTSEMCGTTLSNKPFGPSLDHLCQALGIPTKNDITGATVWDEICKGNIKGVAGYCRWDVRRARSVWRKVNGLPALAVDERPPAPKAEVAA
jgi:3'-5' exonuclease